MKFFVLSVVSALLLGCVSSDDSDDDMNTVSQDGDTSPSVDDDSSPTGDDDTSSGDDDGTDVPPPPTCTITHTDINTPFGTVIDIYPGDTVPLVTYDTRVSGASSFRVRSWRMPLLVSADPSIESYMLGASGSVVAGAHINRCKIAQWNISETDLSPWVVPQEDGWLVFADPLPLISGKGVYLAIMCEFNNASPEGERDGFAGYLLASEDVVVDDGSETIYTTIVQDPNGSVQDSVYSPTSQRILLP